MALILAIVGGMFLGAGAALDELKFATYGGLLICAAVILAAIHSKR